MSDLTPMSPEYIGLLTEIRQRVRQAQTRAVLSVNAELIRLYWEIGALIDLRQRQEGWGAGVILAKSNSLLDKPLMTQLCHNLWHFFRPSCSCLYPGGITRN
jgi:hypothetical protein